MSDEIIRIYMFPVLTETLNQRQLCRKIPQRGPTFQREQHRRRILDIRG